jgi:hypothetical protein
VLEKVRESELIVILHDGPNPDHKAELSSVHRLAILADVVGEAILETPHRDIWRDRNGSVKGNGPRVSRDRNPGSFLKRGDPWRAGRKKWPDQKGWYEKAESTFHLILHRFAMPVQLTTCDDRLR